MTDKTSEKPTSSNGTAIPRHERQGSRAQSAESGWLSSAAITQRQATTRPEHRRKASKHAAARSSPRRRRGPAMPFSTKRDEKRRITSGIPYGFDHANAGSSLNPHIVSRYHLLRNLFALSSSAVPRIRRGRP